MLYSEIKQEYEQNKRVAATPLKYMPVRQKMTMIEEIVNDANANNNFINTLKMEIYCSIYLIMRYYGLELEGNYTENEIPELYDDMKTSGLLDYLYNNIPTEERKFISEHLYSIAEEIFKYRNSAVGIVETLSDKFNTTNMNADEILAKINEMKTLKDIAPLLGQS